MNVFDYLDWRDDILFEELNEIDVLIFNRLSYFPLENIVKSNEKLSIEEAYNRSIEMTNLHYSSDNDIELFKRISSCNRYKNLRIGNVINKLDKTKEEQFMAITIYLPKNYIYISFRGTTNSIIGWKENFNMSYLYETPSQKDSLDYINKIIGHKKIFLGGHSKGGNLAMYAGIHAKKSIKNKIIKIYNYDGPGFMNLDNDYYSMNNKIISYIPKSSVVGRLMNLNNETVVVDSTAKGIFQHDVFTWNVQKKYLDRSTLTDDSNTIKKIIDEWINQMTKDAMHEFVDNVYSILNSTGIERIQQLKISNLKEIILSYKNMDDKTKKALFNVISLLFDSTKQNIGNNIKEDLL